MSAIMYVFGFIGIFFLLAVIMGAMKQKKPFVRAGNAYFAGTEINIKPDEYMDGQLVVNPYKPFHVERVGDEVCVTVYFVKSEAAEQAGEIDAGYAEVN